MSATVTSAELRAWAYLSRVVEPPCPELAELVGSVGPVEAAERVRRGLVDDALAVRTEGWREIDRAAEDLDALARCDGRLVTADDDEWPVLSFAAFGGVGAQAKRECRAPMVLWVRGLARLDETCQRSAAIVGTRAATAYGEHIAADLAAGLTERDAAVISGGAYGIDGAAHRATLACDGITLAVLAGGIDIPYPAGHSALLHRISRSGLLITEYPPGTRPTRYRFLTRNRLVAACADATVVVEAGLRSGAANTASWARLLGRPVAAVPGLVTSSASTGCHVLLRAGAELVTRAEEIVELIGRIGELADDLPHPIMPLDELDHTQRQVYEALPGRGAATIDEIAITARLTPERVLGPLAMLEVAGLVQRCDGRWRITRPNRRTATGTNPPIRR